ncbi:MAG: hypothetical protein LDL30_09190 [Desulfovibrio sp.]|nr:hypothetical protein [Desulfovibrio sp.]MCA1985212.1 hypothetical protein [Desulfovibrio sp.]
MSIPLRAAAALAACLVLVLGLCVWVHAASGVTTPAARAAEAPPVLTIFFTADTKGYFDPCPT